MLFFEDGSPNKDISDALREAERVRKAIRQREDEEAASRQAAARQADGAEKLSPFARRGMDRRSLSVGSPRAPRGR